MNGLVRNHLYKGMNTRVFTSNFGDLSDLNQVSFLSNNFKSVLVDLELNIMAKIKKH